MYCSHCGAELQATERFCAACGQKNLHYVAQPEASAPEQPIYQQPNYQQDPFGQTGYQQQGYQQQGYQQGPYHQQDPYQQNPYYQDPYYQNLRTPREPSPLSVVTKVFLIIGVVATSVSTCGIGLAWTLPMLKSYNRKKAEGLPIATGFKVCTLIFVSLVAGILMLCDHDS